MGSKDRTVYAIRNEPIATDIVASISIQKTVGFSKNESIQYFLICCNAIVNLLMVKTRQLK
jgi:hypothetical protein